MNLCRTGLFKNRWLHLPVIGEITLSAAMFASSLAAPARHSSAGQPCEVVVTVTNSIGALTKDAQVIFAPKSGKAIAPTKGTTDAHGEFKGKLVPGYYNLQVASPGFRRHEEDVNVSCEGKKSFKIPAQLKLGI